MDRSEKHLCKIPGVYFYPLVYLLQETATAPVTTVDLLAGKCYSVTHNSLIEEYVEWKSHLNTCCKTDKVTLYRYLEKLLTGGPLELALQPHKNTKDSQVVIKSMYQQHGGCKKLEKAHNTRMTDFEHQMEQYKQQLDFN